MIYNIKGTKTYSCFVSIDMDSKEEAEAYFENVSIDDCIDVEEEFTTIDEIWSDEDEEKD